MINHLTEEQEQMLFVEWLTLKGYTFTAIPNSTYTTSWKQKRKNYNTGLRAGFPDMVVIAKNKLMFIELKRKVGGVVSQQQKEWIEKISNCNVPVAVCKGHENAIAFVQGVLAND